MLLGMNRAGLSPGEIVSVSCTEFARFVRPEAAFGLAADWTAFGVQFWLTGKVMEENEFRLEDAFEWPEAAGCLVPRRKDQSGMACAALAASSLGAAAWRILSERGCCSFPDEPGDENEAFAEAGRKLTGAAGPEAARRLEADLAGEGVRLGPGTAEEAGEELAL